MYSARRPRRIWTPRLEEDDRRIKTSWFQPTNDTIKEQEKLLAGMYFVVRQGDEFGERLRCSRCRNRHDYITLMCVEKPITGLANGLYAYFRALKEARAEHELSPEQLSRFKQVQDVLNQMPDLSRIHPQYARKVVQDLGPTDMQLGAVSLGILEDISPTKARQLVDKINERGIKPRYVLDPVGQAEIDRSLAYRGRKFTRDRWA